MRRILFLLLVVPLFFIACNKNKNQITLSYTNIEGEVPTHGNFVFMFNQVVAPDSILYYWDEKEYVRFEPAIEGQFKWTEANELTFSPRDPLMPSTNYTAKFTNEITTVNETFSSFDIEDLEFHTQELLMQSADVFWFLSDAGNVKARLELGFNYKVDATEIADALSVKKDAENLKVSLEEEGESYFVSFIIEDIPVKDEDQSITILLEDGILPIGGNNQTAESITETKILKSPYKIEINEVETEHDGVTGTITIKTSQQVQKTAIESYISFSPAVKFTTEVTPKSILVKSADFDVKNSYKLTVKTGLKGQVGGKLPHDYTSDVTFGELEPAIEFENGKGMYLSALGNQNIAVRIINVPEVEVSIYKLYENNLLSANIGNQYYYDDYYYDDYYYGELQEQDLVSQKKYKTSSLAKVGSASLLKFNFKDELDDYDGIYLVKVQSTDDYWLSDSKYISMSDIGLIAKAGKNKVTVFTNSIQSTESLSGVKVKLFGRNNQLISESITASDGSAQLTLKNTNYSGFQPALITAEKNGDFTMLNLYDGRVETSRFEVGGYRDLPNGLQTFIYLERNIYRPGETINYAAIVRNQTWASPGSLPIKVEIITPTGKKLNTYKKTLNEQGSLEGSFTVGSDAITGSYSVYLYTSNDVLLASKNVLVEEFMPDRIKVTTSLSSSELTNTTKQTKLNIVAQNLFGPPAANRNYEVEISFRKKYFSPDAYSDYNFNISNSNSYLDVDFREGTTDEMGEAREEIEMPESFANMGVLEASLITTVFDETGRPVNRLNNLDVYTQDVFYGVGYFNYYLGTNSQMKIPLVAVDKNGKAINGAGAKVQVIKHEYQTVLNKSGSYFRYESNKVEKKIVEKNLTLNGASTFNFTPTVSGEYEVRIYNPEVNGKYVSRYFYAYGYGRTYLSSFEVDNEGRIDIETDKESYNVGDNAKILFKTPFQGKMLVTIEGKDVLEHFYVNTDKRSAEVSIEMIEAYLPNVYVTATLFKPHEESEFPLTVAHGFYSLGVKEESRDTKITIDAVETSRSNTTQKIKVKGDANSIVSIAVVDEGILQVGNFQTPDPFDYFYQKRALQVTSADLYPFLLPEISSSNAGAGGGGFDMATRVNPFQNNRVKLVSFWSGLLKTNAFGEASFEVAIPQFSGSLRVMAVSHKGNAFGSAEKQIVVADPIVISSTIPRFLSPGDTAFIASNISNTTSKSSSVKSTISVSGPLKVIGSEKQSVTVDGNKESRVMYKVYAEKAIGNGNITVSCSAFNEKFKEVTDITIRPSAPLGKSTDAGVVSKSVTLSFDKANYIANTVNYKLVVSKNPMVEFAKDLDYLVRYPYGCSEQTISAVFPQLYYKDLIESMYGKVDRSENINQNITVAINKLKMRQLYNGSISMWDACNQCENWWVTVYAAHFLIEAKKAGFSVDETFLETTLGYLKNRLKSKETVDYYYNRNLSKKIAPKEVPYSLYVLALADEADISLMNYYKTNTAMLAMDGKYLLSAAFVLAGDKEKGKSILPNSFVSEEATRQFGGSFYSPVRDEAIALNALIEIDPKHKDIGIMAKHLSTALKTSRYLNTQDRVFSFLALGKLAKEANSATVEAVVKSNGKVLGNYKEGVMQFGTKEMASGQVEITVSGNGNLFYFWEAEGIHKEGLFEEKDNHLKVRKTFYDRYGNEIRNFAFKQNDLVVVKLSISTDYNGKVENVVITDMLPAGFEIENPRTDEVPGTQWIKNQAYPTNLDVRDDRINIFTDVNTYNGKSQNFYYVVRAVSPGVYKMGPVGADAMYNGEYHSYNGGGWITITE